MVAYRKLSANNPCKSHPIGTSISLTEVEVVLLGIADDDQADNSVDDGCKTHVMSVKRMISLADILPDKAGSNVRLAEGFLPKYLAWYLPKGPLGAISGAGPRGSFS